MLLPSLLPAQKTTLGFYNTQNLFDTIPSKFYDDSQFTPQGYYQWTGERYNRKIDNIAQVLDDMALDVVGLCEVENEEVVKDLVRRLETDYNYIHRSTSDSRGIDIALLYKGDKFFPISVSQHNIGAPREALCVKGELLGCRVDLVIVHMPSLANAKKRREANFKALWRVVESIIAQDSLSKVIVMGDMNAEINCGEFQRWSRNISKKLFIATKGRGGSYCFDGAWYQYDAALVDNRFKASNDLCHLRGGIFNRDYLIIHGTKRHGLPFATFLKGEYLGGYSDHLPCFVEFERQF